MFPYFYARRLRQAGRWLSFSLLLVLLALAGVVSSAGAAPLSREKPTRTPGGMTVSDCVSNPQGDLDAYITDHPDHTTAVFTNGSLHCSYHIGLATYEKVDDNIDHQVFFAGQTAVIAPNSSLTLQVGNPSCAYQSDAFWGRMLTSLAGGVRYGERLLDDTDGVNSVYCTAAATATPTGQPAPPSATATATAAAPSATATNTPPAPSATATATAVPPTNTPTTTPTPGAQKVRPTHTPTPSPAGGAPSPTATVTAAPASPTATTVVIIAPPPPTATATSVLAPPTATATAAVAPPTSTPIQVVGGITGPPAATATRTPVRAPGGAPPPGATGGGPRVRPTTPAAPPTGQGTRPVSRVGPLVGSTNSPAPAELPPTGTTDLAWPLWLALAGLALGSGLLLRRAAQRSAS